MIGVPVRKQERESSPSLAVSTGLFTVEDAEELLDGALEGIATEQISGGRPAEVHAEREPKVVFTGSFPRAAWPCAQPDRRGRVTVIATGIGRRPVDTALDAA